jgi:hypothetical protein
MTTAAQLMSKLSCLTEDQQREVLAYVEKLTDEAKRPRVNPHGICADLRTDLSFHEFQQIRREMWGNATDMEL